MRHAAIVTGVLALAACGGDGDATQPAEPAPTTAPTPLVAPAAQTRQLDHAATAATLAGSFDIRFAGQHQLAWTASTDQDWLVLNQTAASGAGALAFTVDTSKLSAVPNWGRVVAHVRISADGANVMTTLTLDKRLPEITMVSPNAIEAGKAGTVRVLGRGLSQLADGGAIQVAGITGVTGTVVSDSEATLVLPALARGRYAISVPNAMGVEDTTASLAAATALAPAALHRRDEMTSVVFDASRNAVFMAARGSATRARFDGTQWLQDTINLEPGAVRGNPGLMQMAPDGRTLYVATSGALVAIDPDTLAIQASHPLPATWQGAYGNNLRNLALTHDLRLWFTPYSTTAHGSTTTSTNLLAYFDLRTRRFETALSATGFVFPTAPPSIALATGLVIGASGDGARLIGVHPSGTANFIYDAASSRFTTMAALPVAKTLTAVSEDGSTVVLDHDSLFSVQPGGMQLEGAIAQTPGQTTFASALSADKTRLYAVVGAPLQQNGLEQSIATAHRVAVFDARAPGAGSSLPQLGTVNLPAGPMGCDLTPRALVPCPPGGILQISPLGDSLRWFDFADGMITLPLAATLRPLNAAGR